MENTVFNAQVERSITKTYRKRIWTKFISAVKEYELISEGDRIAVCVSGGKDSMLLAKLMQLLNKYSDFPFEVKFLAMDPGYNSENWERIQHNADLLGIPLNVFKTNIFDVVDKIEKSPCYLCARMRRGYLYKHAKLLGCNKIALGHHFSDVIETTVLSMFYSGQLQGMIPKLKSKNYEGMELIRPMYKIQEKDIILWKNYNGLEFINCACKFTERNAAEENEEGDSKRREIKLLIKELGKTNPNIEKSIFNSLHNVHIETFPGIKKGDVTHSFLEDYYS